VPSDRDKYEPKFENVREYEKNWSNLCKFECHESDHSEGEQSYCDFSFWTILFVGDPQEREHVDDIGPFIEGLVVLKTAQIENAHPEQIGKVDSDRN
jgi:hypothetical protein